MMDWYDEDFYHEPSEFEIGLVSLRDSLLKSVKEEFITEMERLKVENAELQEVKKNFEQIKSEYRRKENQLHVERQDLERKVRYERLSLLMKDFEHILYRANSERERGPKCDRCNNNRQIEYLTPLGRKATEDCACSFGKLVYKPKEYKCTEFKINHDKNGLTAWYRINEERDYDYGSSEVPKKIWAEGDSYEDVRYYSDLYFKTVEDCQKYCDWLTERERLKEAEGHRDDRTSLAKR